MKTVHSKQLLNTTLAFAGGALAMVILDAAWARRRVAIERPSDVQLRARVRARIPDLVSQPDAVEVEVRAGVVRVSGQVPAAERSSLLMKLTEIPGVRLVRNAVSVTESAQHSSLKA